MRNESLHGSPELAAPRDSFATRDIYLAAFLFRAGERLTTTHRENTKVTFVFQQSSTLGAQVEAFYRHDCPARQLFDAYRTVKQIGFDR